MNRLGLFVLAPAFITTLALCNVAEADANGNGASCDHGNASVAAGYCDHISAGNLTFCSQHCTGLAVPMPTRQIVLGANNGPFVDPDPPPVDTGRQLPPPSSKPPHVVHGGEHHASFGGNDPGSRDCSDGHRDGGAKASFAVHADAGASPSFGSSPHADSGGNHANGSGGGHASSGGGGGGNGGGGGGGGGGGNGGGGGHGGGGGGHGGHH